MKISKTSGMPPFLPPPPDSSTKIPSSAALQISHLLSQNSRSPTRQNDPSKAEAIKSFFDPFFSSSHDPLNFFKNIHLSKNIKPQYKDFYINFSVLYHILKHIPENNHPLRTKLAVRILNYLYKFSTPSSVVSLTSSMNPVQEKDWEKEVGYHRFEESNLRKSFTQALAKLLDVPQENIKPVTSGRSQELVKRNYVLNNNANIFTWKDGGIVNNSSEISSTSVGKISKPFYLKFPNIAEAILQIKSKDKRCLYFDITENFEQLSKHPIQGCSLLFKQLRGNSMLPGHPRRMLVGMPEYGESHSNASD